MDYGAAEAMPRDAIVSKADGALASVYGSLTAVAKMLDDIERRLSQTGSRMFGAAPVPVDETKGINQNNPPAIQQLENIAATLHNQAQMLNDVTRRLEQL